LGLTARVAVALAVIALLAVLPLAWPAQASEDDEYDEEYGEEAGLAGGLGAAAAWGGAAATLALVLAREAYPRLARAGLRPPPRLYPRIVEAHALVNGVSAAAGLAHGYALRARAGPVEYALAGMVAYTAATGLLLWLSRGDKRRMARLVHGQRLATLLLALLLALHVARMGD